MLNRRALVLSGTASAVMGNLGRPVAAATPTVLLSLGELQVAPVGIGTWAWGNRLLYGYSTAEDAELESAFDALMSRGVPILFDTADSYGTGDLAGRSELLLGRFSRQHPSGKNAVLATKLAPYPSRLTAKSFVDAAKDSSGRLQRLPIDVAQAHWSTVGYAPWQEGPLIEGLGQMQLQGVAKQVGVSNYGSRGLRRVHASLSAMGVKLASAQVQYSLLSRQAERSGLLEVAQELGVRVLAYSPLCLGLLTGRYDENNLPKGPRGVLFKSQAKQVANLIGVLREVAASRGVSPSQVAINWTRARGALPIPGVRTRRQAQEALQCLDFTLSAAEVAELDAAAARCTVSATQNPFSSP